MESFTMNLSLGERPVRLPVSPTSAPLLANLVSFRRKLCSTNRGLDRLRNTFGLESSLFNASEAESDMGVSPQQANFYFDAKLPVFQAGAHQLANEGDILAEIVKSGGLTSLVRDRF